MMKKAIKLFDDNMQKLSVKINSIPHIESIKANIDPFIIPFLYSMFIYIFIVTAWYGDDSYITFRTIDNFVNGYGLTWNISERVQVYTHPLWMFLVSFFYFFTHEVYLTVIFISFILCLLVIYTIHKRFSTYNSKIKKLDLVFFFCLILSSKAFMDYTASGLENPLSFLLVTLFYTKLLWSKKSFSQFSSKDILVFFFISSLAFVNRMDTILLFIPALLLLFYFNFRKIGWKWVIFIFLGFLPSILWIAFSIIYYGFPFPNTAYSKLNNTYGLIASFIQGLYYFKFTLKYDIFSLLIIFIPFFYYRHIKKEKDYKSFALIASILLYCLYILKIGGDFMGGRFFTIPFLLSSIFLLANSTEKQKKILILFAIISSLILILLFKVNIYKKHILFTENHGVTDEKYHYFFATGLVNQLNKFYPGFFWYKDGLKLREEVINKKTKKVILFNNIGFIGFTSGPKVHIIDKFSLPDPLLSKLPGSGRIGHLERQIPDGYVESVVKDDNLIVDPNLKQYYDKIKIITQGPIWSKARFETIYKMNMGYYDFLIDNYLNNELHTKK